jgi:leucyl-tRNA synthetase
VTAKTLDEQVTLADSEPPPTYDHRAIEPRWQAAWQDARLYLTPKVSDAEQRPAYIFASHPSLAHDSPLDLIRTYSLADSYARFMRARGAQVLFSFGFDAFGLVVERDALDHDVTPAAWVRDAITRISRQFHSLGFSLDISRFSRSDDPNTYRFSQQLFLALLEKGLIYRIDSEWHLRLGAYVQRNDERLTAVEGWNDLALVSQRTIPGSVDGVEFDVVSVDGTPLTVFTPHERAIKQAEFVAMSPNHPDIEQWISTADMRAGMDRALEAAPDADPDTIAIATGRLISGVGTENPLPLIVSSAVDASFGPTAVLGIPAVQPGDAPLAEQVEMPAVNAWRIEDRGPSSVRPAHRYSAHDVSLSERHAWGTPIPVIHCDACGPIPVPVNDLPLALPDDPACSCPSCSGPARRETDTLNPYFDRLWQWLTPCMNVNHTSARFDDPELRCSLPAQRAIVAADHGGLLFDQRAIAKALRDCELLSHDEPFAGVTMHERIQLTNPKERIHIEGLVKRAGADAIRLTLLYAAAPAHVLPWKSHTLRYCHTWLTSFWSYAMPRLQRPHELANADQHEGAAPLQGRLARWTAIAIDRVTENYEQLDVHRAVRNVMVLFVRIQDFEQRVVEQYDDLTPADNAALARALLVAVQLIAPVTPHIAEEFWAAAGADGLLAAAPWPVAQAG